MGVLRRALYFFSPLSDQDTDWLIGIGEKEVIQAGTVLVREGAPVDHFYVTTSGVFSASRRHVRIYTIGPGEVMGSLAFLESRPSATTIVADTDATAIHVPFSIVRTKLAVDRAFAARFYHALALMLAGHFSTRIIEAACGEAHGFEDSTEEFGEITDDRLDSAALAAARFEKLRRADMLREGP